MADSPKQTEPVSGKKSDLKVRVISAVVLLPAVLFAVWYGSWIFVFLALAAGIIGMREYSALILGQSYEKWIDRSLILSLVAAVAAQVFVSFSFAVVALVLCASSVFGVASRTQTKRPGELALGLIYIGSAIISILYLRDLGHGERFDRGLYWIAFLLGVIWCTDIFAYFGGRAIGGPKIAPRISPKKTWAGLISGSAAAMIFAIGMTLAFGKTEAIILAAAMAVIMAVIAQSGDFLESHLKRRAGVKDSGTLIPGHGGILDRVDGLLPAAIFLALMHLALLQHIGWWVAQ